MPIRRRAHASNLMLRAVGLTSAVMDSLERDLNLPAAPETARRTVQSLMTALGKPPRRRHGYTLPQVASALTQLHDVCPLTTSQRRAIQELLPAYDRTPMHFLRAVRREVLTRIQRKKLPSLLRAADTENLLNPCESTTGTSISDIGSPVSGAAAPESDSVFGAPFPAATQAEADRFNSPP
jgi:hypothetical protein